MPRLWALAKWFLLFSPGLLFPLSTPPTCHAEVFVNLVGFVFEPRDIVIPAGETVTWVNVEGMFHTITNGIDSGDPSMGTLFNETVFSEGQLFSHTFSAAGFYPYFCIFHEALDMRGTVTVTGTTGAQASSWGAIKSLFR